MLHRSRKDQLGFSLVEILIAIAVFAIIFIAALMIYDRSNRVFKTGVESSATQQATRVAFDRLVADLRMAGFDYDRDGIPSSSIAGVNQSQQPDEQIEYIGQGAITIRSNFDYDTDPNPVIPAGKPKCDKGCDQDYVPAGLEFPIVTTGNDEIVTFVLMSPTAPAGNPVKFFVDSYKPRAVYSVLAGTPTKEKEISIDSTVNGAGQTLYPDQTNQYPPYTLYRVNLNPNTADGTPVIYTPVAENIRSLSFRYYQDSAGTLPLQDLATPPVVIPQANLATQVGGQGQYDPANPASAVVPRAIRSRIQAIRVTLIGMNEAADFNYTDPTETIAAMKPYRKYRLESLISPRNYARRGFREQEFKEPGAPTLTKVCYGYCSLFHLEWQAPAADATKGGVESYAVVYDTDLVGGFANIIDVGNTTSAFVSVPDPMADWYFAVEAVNSYGAATSAPLGPFSAKNATVPAFDSTGNHASGDGHPEHLPQASKISLWWKMPNAAASGTITCSIGTPPPVYPVQETKGFQVYRRVDTPASGEENTDPLAVGAWKKIVDETVIGAGAPTFDPLTNTVNWVDTTAADCVNYWYKVRAVERCDDNAENVSNNALDNFSAFSAPINGRASSPGVPAAPANLDIDYSGVPSQSKCDAGLNKCQAMLVWPKVQFNTAAEPIAVEYYQVERVRKKNGVNAGYFGIPAFPSPTNNFLIDSTMYTETAGQLSFMVNDPAFVEHDTDLINFSYEFRVRAISPCTPTTPASPPWSPVRTFPCPFVGGIVSASLSNTIQGAGTLANPWLIAAPATATASTTNPVVFGRMTIYGPTGAQMLCEQSGSFTSFNCAWPTGLPDEQVFRLEVFLQDTTGCTTSRSFFASESNNSCCLTPQSVDASIVFVDAPSQRVRIRLDNNCSNPLTIMPNGIRIEWNPALVTGGGGGQKRLDFVRYPNNSGGNTRHDIPNAINDTSPVLSDPTQATTNGIGKNPVNANSNSYSFDVHFNKTFTTSPVTKVCVTYQRVGIDLTDQVCKIVPVASNTPNVCD